MESRKLRSREDILPIDRGWAWVIVAAGSLMFALIAGGFKSQGIILVELTERHPHIPSSHVLWAFTIVAMGHILGPVISFILTKLTHRTVLIGGLLLFASGSIGLAYTTTLPGIIFLYSLPTGIGNSTIFLSLLLSLAPYFNKRKALAFGLVASGSGFGTLILPYILRGLFDNLSFPEAMLYYAGFMLQFICLACLVRPLSYYEDIHRKELKAWEASNVVEVIDDGKRSISIPKLEYLSKSADNVNELKLRDLKSSRSLLRNVQVEDNAEAWTFLSMGNLAMGVSQEFGEESHVNRDLSLNSGGDQAADISRLEKGKKSSTKDKFNIRLIFNPKMVMFNVSVFVYCMGCLVVYQCLPSLAKESGVSKSTVALVFTVVGSLEIPFRAANGYLADRHIVTGYTQYMVALTLAGSAVLAGGLLSGLAGLIVALFGLSACGTSVFSLIPVVLTELLGSENLTTAMGVQLSAQGIAVLLTTTITGRIYDVTGSWQHVFMYISGCMIAGGVMLLPYWIYMKWSHICVKSSKKTEETCISHSR